MTILLAMTLKSSNILMRNHRETEIEAAHFSTVQITLIQSKQAY